MFMSSFAYPSAENIAACPTARVELGDRREPLPDMLACSLSLPGEAWSGRIARSAVEAVLHAHGLDRLAPAAVQVTGELLAAAWRLDPGGSVYLSARYRDDTLRIAAYDGHQAHGNARLAAHCEARRRAALRLLRVVVRECGGEWGFGDSREPGGGTRTWVTLPRAGALAYLPGRGVPFGSPGR